MRQCCRIFRQQGLRRDNLRDFISASLCRNKISLLRLLGFGEKHLNINAVFTLFKIGKIYMNSISGHIYISIHIDR